MRYYDITITDKTGKQFAMFSTLNGTGLHIELNAPITTGASPAGEVTLKVFNLPLSMFARTHDFQDKHIVVRGGMDQGLPLANPAQKGILVQGLIFFASGVREGKANYLTFTLIPQDNIQSEPKNLVLSWYKGTKLEEAIKNTMTNAGIKNSRIFISPNLVAMRDTHAVFATMRQFADYLSKFGIFNFYRPALEGYDFLDKESAQRDKPKQVSILDMLGQPTWLGAGSAAIKVVLRGDIILGDYIEIKDPQLSQQSGTVNRDISTSSRLGFKGIFFVTGITHYANYYDHAAENWCTVLSLVTTEKVTV